MGVAVLGNAPRRLGSHAARRVDAGREHDAGRYRLARAERLPHPALGLAVAVIIACGGAWSGPVSAQNPGNGERPSALGIAPPPAIAVRIEVPSLILGLPASEASLGIRLVTAGELPANSFVRIRGLPPQVSLSDGHAIAPGAWAVPIAALADLRIVIPAGLAGRSEVTITLVGIDSGSIAEARTMLVVAGAALSGVPSASETPPAAPSAPSRVEAPTAPPEPAPKAAPAVIAAPPPSPRVPPPPAVIATPLPPAPPPAAKPPPPSAKPAVPTPSPEALQRARGFHARGQVLLDGGDIASARLLFERAADAGLWEGALAMGSTFDTAELSRRRTVGVRPDHAEARRWYERARDLGGGTAVERYLARLGPS